MMIDIEKSYPPKVVVTGNGARSEMEFDSKNPKDFARAIDAAYQAVGVVFRPLDIERIAATLASSDEFRAVFF